MIAVKKKEREREKLKVQTPHQTPADTGTGGERRG